MQTINPLICKLSVEQVEEFGATWIQFGFISGPRKPKQIQSVAILAQDSQRLLRVLKNNTNFSVGRGCLFFWVGFG